MLFKKQPQEPKEKENPMIIDYRTMCWGHTVTLGERNEDLTYNIHGFNHRVPEDGDLFLRNMEGGLCVYLLWDVEPCNDPSDMYFAKTGIIRYATETDLAKLDSQKPMFI
jgi:hypothetical protein